LPSFKSGVQRYLTLNALVRLTASEPSPEGHMLHFKGVGWIFADHVSRTDEFATDYVKVARSRVGAAPYVWGGRSNPDCSALVMDSLLSCGIPCPRNAGEQAKSLGEEIAFEDDFSNLQKGDFVFWTQPGTKGRHVVIMTDPHRCVHATIASPYRGTVEQSLVGVIQDQERDGNGRPNIVRRLPKMNF